jgi:hypothetical protein
MGFSKDEGQSLRVKKCRTYYPKCDVCLKPIFKGELFAETCGSRTKRCGVAHASCLSMNKQAGVHSILTIGRTAKTRRDIPSQQILATLKAKISETRVKQKALYGS